MNDSQIELTENIGKKILKKLRSAPNELHGIVNILRAKVPIIQFVHTKSGIKCDLSFSNEKALINSKFIRMCHQIDSRIHIIATVIK